MKIKTRVAVELWGGLSALDGAPRIVKADGKETIVQMPYKFDDTVRRLIYRNMARLKVEIDAFNHSSKQRFLDIASGREALNVEKNPDDAEIIAKINAANEKALEEEIDVDLQHLRLDRLIAGGAIPGTVLAALAPIIDDEAEKAVDDEGD